VKNHKDLPPSSQKWANDVDAAMAEINRLTEVVRRLSQNAGLDYANPQRGLATGNIPSVQNPVGQKLSSLADVATYNVADKQVLSWSQQGQKWLPATLSTGGAFPIPDAIAGFPNAYGYGYLPTVTDGPYSVLAQSADPEGNFNLTARTVNGGVDSYQSVYSNDGSLLVSCGGTGYADLAMGENGWLTLASSATGSSILEMRGGEWELGYNNGTSDASRIYSYSFTSLKIQDSVGVEIIGPYLKPPGCTTANRPSTLGPADKGANVYDFDLGIPIWWSGTVWKNAIGTTV